MKKFIKDTKFKLGSAVVALGTLFITDPVFAATDPQAKLVQAGNTIKLRISTRNSLIITISERKYSKISGSNTSLIHIFFHRMMISQTYR